MRAAKSSYNGREMEPETANGNMSPTDQVSTGSVLMFLELVSGTH